MANKRKSDPNERTWFRTGRIFRDGSAWYFYTREKSVEGPYQSEALAERHLEIYIGLQNSSFLANDHGLKLTPMDRNKTV